MSECEHDYVRGSDDPVRGRIFKCTKCGETTYEERPQPETKPFTSAGEHWCPCGWEGTIRELKPLDADDENLIANGGDFEPETRWCPECGECFGVLKEPLVTVPIERNDDRLYLCTIAATAEPGNEVEKVEILYNTGYPLLIVRIKRKGADRTEQYTVSGEAMANAILEATSE